MPSRNKLYFAIGVLLIALFTGLGTLWFAMNDRNGAIGSGNALIGGHFELTDQDGRRVTEKDFLGRYMLVFFGYTFCPDICPAELQIASAALDELGDLANEITPVFVTIDPARDTPAVMKEYVANFRPGMVGLTGSADDIARVAGVFRVYYAKPESSEDNNDYLMDHSTILYLMGPDGKFVKHFSYGTDVKTLAEGLRSAIQK